MAGKSKGRRIARYWPRFLLVIPFLLVVWVPFYNRVEPTLGGVPFFYWYQLGAILIGAGVALTVYWLELWVTRTTERAARRGQFFRDAGRYPLSLNLPATAVFVALFLFVTWVGFIAARWRKADLNLLHEWGLGGRRFGTVVTWFLLGGDLYTAYTFIAVPALVFGAGAVGFFAVPYTIMIYPILYLVFPRLWAIARERGHVTAADYVRERFDSRFLALAVALTGILATMPYIALQLVGMEVVIGALGFPAGGFVGHLPLIIAFVILAAFTYTSGLRAPALIAVVKDMLIFVTIFAAIVIIPAKLGGYGAIFASVPPEKLTLEPPSGASLGSYSAYVTLALGSALALFLYPHSMTGILSASSGKVIRRNAAALSAYSFVLGLIALLGYMAIAAGVDKNPAHAAGFAQYGANFAVPALFLDMFPSWFVGVAFAAIAIGALVPGGDHVDRLRQSLHPQSLQGVLAAALHRCRRGAHGEDRLPRGQGRRRRVHRGDPAQLRHPPPAPRRHLDHPAPAADPARPVHAALQCPCAALGVGRRNGHRHVYGGHARLPLVGLSPRNFRPHDPRLCRPLLGARELSHRRGVVARA